MVKQNVVRGAYLLAVAGPLSLGWLSVSGRLWDLVQFPEFLGGFLTVLAVTTGILFAAVAGLYLYLAYRPRWWGKLVCLWAGVSWIGFAGMSRLMHGGNPVLWGPAGAGALLLLVALVHHVADPSLGPLQPVKRTGTAATR